MGFLSSMFSAVVKTAVTPLAVIADVSKAVQGETPDTTVNVIGSAAEDVFDAFNEPFD